MPCAVTIIYANIILIPDWLCNYAILVILGVNRKWFGLLEFCAISRIMQLAEMQLAGTYCT